MTKTPIDPGDIRKGDLIRKEWSGCQRMRSAEYVAAAVGDSYAATDDGALFLIDRLKPPVVLPTEVGYYIACDGGMDRIEFEGELLPERYAPYTKLEPVAETAKRVLDRVMDATGAAPTSFTSEKILEVAAEFGATS